MEKITGQYKIGQFIAILREEYDDISASSLRFWEKEGLIIPSGSGKGSGTHRIYTDEDIEIIRFIKELSNGNYSISIIKRNLELCGKDINFIKTQTDIYKRMRHLSGYLREVLKTERGQKFYEYVYPEDTFIKILTNDEKASFFIKEAQRHKLIFPRMVSNIKMYNQMDYTIMRLIIGLGSASLEKYNRLTGMIEYMKIELDLNSGIFLPAIKDLNEIVPFQQGINVKNGDRWLTSALLYLETVYYEEFRSKK